jgi:hypothetical protein
LLLYFAVSLFASAVLLFLVQPMIGKMILPRLGGTPAVWNTCMVFFQAVLLIGYGYTHMLATTQKTKRQVLIHGALLLLPFIVLPFSLGDWEPPTDSNPIFSLMGKLAIMVGLPFFMVSTTAPLLQKWFHHTGHQAAKDPYFLYGASNFGSMLGLALYPTVLEPWLQLQASQDSPTWKTQVMVWTIGYAIFVGLVIGCAIAVWMAISNKIETPEPTPEPTPAPAPAVEQATAVTASAPVGLTKRKARLETAPATAPVTPTATEPNNIPPPPWEGLHPFWALIVWWYSHGEYHLLTTALRAEHVAAQPPQDHITWLRRIRWIGLAAVPSSLMLGVTTYMTTDIAAVAFFWIIPLALYLFTFILVFSRWPTVWTGTPHTVVMFLQPMVLLLLVLKMIGNLSLSNFSASWSTVIEFMLHLAAFFFTTLMCHGELAKDRPSTKHLTEFYFWMSLGGVLGGLFNALFSPIVFQYGIWEYWIAMAFACLLRSNLVDQAKTLIPGDSTNERPTPIGITLDFAVPVVLGIACYALSYVGDFHGQSFFLLKKSYLLAVLVVIVLALSLRPVRFGLSVLALFIAVNAYERYYDPYLYEGRGFFGLLRVRESDGDEKRGWQPLPAKMSAEGKLVGDQPPYEWKVYRTLIHGGINHGRQIIRYRYADENDKIFPETVEMNFRKRREPITYFHEMNGVAELFHKLSWPNAQPPIHVLNMTGLSDARLPASMVGFGAGESPWLAMLANTQSEPPYAVLGLGTGILGCYAKPYQHVDIYEIDPLVKQLSIVPGYVPPWDPKRSEMPKDLDDPVFYFVHDAQERWANINVILGDGRLKIRDAHAEKYYHVIALDAFSSDAIPVHLLTKEAIEIYLSKLAPGGVLLFNTTNRYVRIEGVLAALAEELDCDCLYCPDYTWDSTDHPDRFSADWVVLQPRMKEGSYKTGGRPIRERLEAERVRQTWYGKVVKDEDGKPVVDRRWQEVNPLPGPVWTDGYSNLLNPRIMPWIAPWKRR